VFTQITWQVRFATDYDKLMLPSYALLFIKFIKFERSVIAGEELLRIICSKKRKITNFMYGH
jgi:hypothetical protein